MRNLIVAAALLVAGRDGPIAVPRNLPPLPGPQQKSVLAQWAEFPSRDPVRTFCDATGCHGWVYGSLLDVAAWTNTQSSGN